MTEFTRRESLSLGAAALGATLLPVTARADDDVPTAKFAPMDLKLEQGAELRVLRPAKFVDPDEVFWKSNTKKYIDATGIPMSRSISSAGKISGRRPRSPPTPAPDPMSSLALVRTRRFTPQN